MEDEQAEGAEDTGSGRDDDVWHVRLAREQGRMHRAAPTEREEDELARVTADLARHRAHRAYHRRVDDGVHPVRRFFEPKTERLRDLVGERRAQRGSSSISSSPPTR